MKILFLVPSFPTISETFILNQIIDLIDRGHEVTIFASFKTNVKLHSKTKKYGLTEKVIYAIHPKLILQEFKNIVNRSSFGYFKNNLKILNSFNFFKFGFESLTFKSYFRISWMSQLKDDFDIVHAHFAPMSEFYFRGRKCGFFKKSKLVVTFHGNDIVPSEYLINKKQYSHLFSNKATLTVNTNYTKALVLQICKSYKNIHILPVGLNTNYYKPVKKEFSSKLKRILFCGRFVEFKGLNQLVKIAQELIHNRKRSDIEFVVIGSGTKRNVQNLKEEIKSLQLKNYFKLLGLKTQDEVISEMNKSHIFVSPGITSKDGRAENQGLVIQEAQSMKLPVVVTNAGGMKYGLLENESGFVVDQNNTIKFCDKIELLLDDDKLRFDFGETGREYVKNNYDSLVLGNQLEIIYLTKY